jgi:tRNA (cmo5U34)-methyltransferase
MQRMAALLLAECLKGTARILVLGAGGRLELKVFAELQPKWKFVGVDPSTEMLGLAAKMIAPHASRVDFHEGYIESASEGPLAS